MNMFTKLYLPNMFKGSDLDCFHPVLKCVLQIPKSLKSDNIPKGRTLRS